MVVRKLKLPTQGEVTEKNSDDQDTVEAVEAIQDSNEEATSHSSSEDFILSTQFFDYLPGQIYEVVASPQFLTTIALKPGERITSISAGDTHRWQVSQTSTGSRPAQTLLLIKPLREWLETNMVITTNSRMYQISLKSVPNGVYNATVAWRYPSEAVLRLIRPDGTQTPEVDESLGPIHLGRVNFKYRIALNSGRRKPSWIPEQVFDDHEKTYIKFPIGNKISPVVFVNDNNGHDKVMVNYRVNGNYYIIDKVIDKVVLQHGETSIRVTRRERYGVGGYWD